MGVTTNHHDWWNQIADESPEERGAQFICFSRNKDTEKEVMRVTVE